MSVQNKLRSAWRIDRFTYTECEETPLDQSVLLPSTAMSVHFSDSDLNLCLASWTVEGYSVGSLAFVPRAGEGTSHGITDNTPPHSHAPFKQIALPFPHQTP